MPRHNSINHPVRTTVKEDPHHNESTDLFQTNDRDFAEEHTATEGEVPMGMLPGQGASDHNVNTIVQPAISVQSSLSRSIARLIESMSIKMDVNYSKEEFEMDVERLEKKLQKRIPISLGKKGKLSLFYLKGTDYYDFFIKDSSNSIIGIFAVLRRKTPRSVAVHVQESFRGQGLGTVLYLAAIHVLGELSSSSNIGIMAVRTWHSVSKYHPVELLDRLDVPVKFKWGKDSIPIVSGKPINKVPDRYTFRATRE